MTKPAPVRSCATPGTGLEEQARSCLSGEAVAQPAVQMHGPREGHRRGGTQGEVMTLELLLGAHMMDQHVENRELPSANFMDSMCIYVYYLVQVSGHRTESH